VEKTEEQKKKKFISRIIRRIFGFGLRFCQSFGTFGFFGIKFEKKFQTFGIIGFGTFGSCLVWDFLGFGCTNPTQPKSQVFFWAQVSV
jgi:hypothetical protein